MKTLLIRALQKGVRILSANSETEIVETSEAIQARRVKPWFEDNGDKTHRLNYDLTPESIVMDLGGYEGQWASDIYSKYNCKILVFEPFVKFAESIKVRFEKNSNIRVFPFGLGAEDITFILSDSGDASSAFIDNHGGSEGKIKSIKRFVESEGIKEIDLIKINIEGGEYELLEYLVNSGLVTCFKNIQVQFHDFIIENAEQRMKKIQENLSNTHELTYSYEFVWDNWRLKE